jgi:hypothetical protein
VAVSVSAVFAEEAAAPAVAKPEVKAPAAPMTATCYSCDKCHMMAMAAGKCAMCGEEMTGKHILAVKDGKAMLCTCGADCKCTLKGDDMTKCGCGKPIASVSLKGKYMCACGADCPKCHTISDKAGKCECGMDMKLVE